MDSGHFELEELERFIQANERSMRELEQAMNDLHEVTGSGENRAGTVSAKADAQGRITAVKITPRAMRMESPELSEAVLEAVRAAQDDQERQAKELMAPMLHDDVPNFGGDLMKTFQRSLAEIQESFRDDLDEGIDRARRAARDLDG